MSDLCGLPADLSDDAILARVVALEKQRAKEEARGLVHNDHRIELAGESLRRARGQQAKTA